jgi:hypothetical protein
MSARSGAPGQPALKRLFPSVNDVEERVEKPSWRGLVPGGEIERRKLPCQGLTFTCKTGE